MKKGLKGMTDEAFKEKYGVDPAALKWYDPREALITLSKGEEPKAIGEGETEH